MEEIWRFLKIFKFNYEKKELIALVSDVGRHHSHQKDFPPSVIESTELQEKEDMDDALTIYEEKKELEENAVESENVMEEVTVPNKGNEFRAKFVLNFLLNL